MKNSPSPTFTDHVPLTLSSILPALLLWNVAQTYNFLKYKFHQNHLEPIKSA